MRPDPERRRWRLPWRNVLAGVVALLALVALAISPLIGLKVFSAVRNHETAVSNVHAHHVGDQVHDGDMDFVVRSADCGRTALTAPGGRRLHPKNGSFCVVSVTVHNAGPEPLKLPRGVQLATGSRGAVYLPDFKADARINGGDPMLAPRESRNATLVYDVPIGIHLREISLHGAEYSRGVVVRL